MASEHDFSRGARLCALITSFQMGTTMRSVLNKWNPDDEAHESWENLAEQLQQGMVNSRFAALMCSLCARPKDTDPANPACSHCHALTDKYEGICREKGVEVTPQGLSAYLKEQLLT